MSNQSKYKTNTKEELETFISSNWNEINDFIDDRMKELPTPIYSSVDIRESSTKFAPVDMNIYPAGFNNLCLLDLDYSSRVFKETIDQDFPNQSIKTIGIIPESHTKNLFYLDHLAYLQKSLNDAGYKTFFIGLDEVLFEEGEEKISLISHSKFEIEIFNGKINDGILFAGESALDLCILNNDQSNPLNIEWNTIKTPVVPTPQIGWFRRQKNEHFKIYCNVVRDFSEKFSINPDLMMAKYKTLEGVDFSNKEGLEELGAKVDELIAELPQNSKVFVKASQGTYGMGISVVSSGKEMVEMNRKKRDKMNIGKNKIKFTSVIIQEGVDSMVKYDEMAAEIAIYLVGGKPVGGFVRANSKKDAQENLNSAGMVFRKYCISEVRQNNDFQTKEAVYSVIARLSTMAGAIEIKDVL